VARYTRHQLKEDRFATAVQDQMSWAVENRKLLTVVGAIAAAVVLVLVGGFFYLQTRDEKASVALSGALRTYETPLRPAAAPAPAAGIESFTSAKDRAEAAQRKFRAVIHDFPYTRSADFARYWVGATAMDLGDYKTAEQELQQLTGSRRDDLAGLAKFALASAYHAEGKDGSAIQLYKELIDHPNTMVPKSTAQIELAALYENTQPAEAARIYEQIRKDDPSSAAAQIASARLQAGKAQ
jgi:TolA-binding protein